MKNSIIREVAKLEAEMAANPPVIVWRPNNRGIQVADSIRDPHTDKVHTPRRRADPVAGFIASLGGELGYVGEVS
jgi:hypothetical protein